jgi:hypothetical protein
LRKPPNEYINTKFSKSAEAMSLPNGEGGWSTEFFNTKFSKSAEAMSLPNGKGG